MKIERLSLMKD